MPGDGPDDGDQEEQELGVVVGRVAGLEQVVARVVGQRPVEVLARAVDAGERLLVQQELQAVAVGHALHGLHDQHVVVGGDVGVLERDGQLVLRRRDLVVPGLDRDAELVELGLGLEHAGQDALGDGAEVMVLHLLALGRLGAEEGPAGVDQVGPGEVEVLVDQEVLLLGAGRGCRRATPPSRRAAGSAGPASRALPSSGAGGSSCRAPRRSRNRTRSGCRAWCRWGSRG